MQRHSRNIETVKLAVESLEPRQLLAGNVVASVRAGLLDVRGDILDNSVEIREDTPGQFTISGLDGTTVNGQPAAVMSGVILDLRVNLRAGANTARLTNVDVLDNLTIGGAPGRNVVMLNQVHVGNDTRISLGLGADAVEIVDSALDDQVFVNTGWGNDTVFLSGSTFKDDVRLLTSNGLDDVNIVDCVFQDNFDLETGFDADRVRIEGVTFDDETEIHLGGGSDDLTIVRSAFNDDTVIDGGRDFGNSDTDSFGEGLDNFYGRPRGLQIVNFEVRSQIGGNGE